MRRGHVGPSSRTHRSPEKKRASFFIGTGPQTASHLWELPSTGNKGGTPHDAVYSSQRHRWLLFANAGQSLLNRAGGFFLPSDRAVARDFRRLDVRTTGHLTPRNIGAPEGADRNRGIRSPRRRFPGRRCTAGSGCSQGSYACAGSTRRALISPTTRPAISTATAVSPSSGSRGASRYRNTTA